MRIASATARLYRVVNETTRKIRAVARVAIVVTATLRE